MAIYTGDYCFWCGKQDMTILIHHISKEKADFMLCVPCINEVYQDWKSEQASTPSLSLVK